MRPLRRPEEVTTVREIDLLQGVEDSGSFRVSFTSDDEDDEAPFAVHVEMAGVVDPAGRRFDLEGRLDLVPRSPDGAVDQADLALSSEMAMRSDGTTTWVHVGSVWTEKAVDADDADGDLGGPDPIGDFLVDPLSFVADLRDEADSFTEVGREEVDGVATTRYRADGVDGGEPLDVWLDDDDRPRRVQGQGATLELSDFGVAVDIVAPDDVTAEEDWITAMTSMFVPALTGDWALRAGGEVDGQPWEVFRADAELAGTATACWTFEPAGGDGAPDEFAEAFIEGFGLDRMPAHEGHLATCPGLLGGTSMTSDPAVVLVPTAPFSPSGVTAVVVSDRFVDSPVVAVADDGTEVILALDAGVAVWSPAAATADVVELRLADGTVTCPVDPDGAVEPGALGDIGACVRA